MSEHGPFTIADTVHIETIMHAAQQGARVRWLDNGDLREGVARCIAHDGGGFLQSDEDVRDGFLHVSGMFEQWLPVTKLLGMVERGEFGIER